MFIQKIIAVSAVCAMLNTIALATVLQDIPLQDIDGHPTSLAAYKGKVVLLVNVASKCGYTKQYKPLEAVYQKYKDQGLVIVGVPSNDFGGQEPGSAEDIKTFCKTQFDVSFPLMGKVGVSPGPSQHALYAALTAKDAPFPGKVAWNFTKFLISRDGKIVARFASGDEPDSETVTKAIQAALAAK